MMIARRNPARFEAIEQPADVEIDEGVLRPTAQDF
jgi:hypothetical protein